MGEDTYVKIVLYEAIINLLEARLAAFEERIKKLEDKFVVRPLSAPRSTDFSLFANAVDQDDQ